jgi:hypothetical protein
MYGHEWSLCIGLAQRPPGSHLEPKSRSKVSYRGIIYGDMEARSSLHGCGSFAQISIKRSILKKCLKRGQKDCIVLMSKVVYSGTWCLCAMPSSSKSGGNPLVDKEVTESNSHNYCHSDSWRNLLIIGIVSAPWLTVVCVQTGYEIRLIVR